MIDESPSAIAAFLSFLFFDGTPVQRRDRQQSPKPSLYLLLYFQKICIWYPYPLPLGNPTVLNARINRAGPF